MVTLGDVIDPDMQFRAARRPAGDLFTQEKVVVAAQRLAGVDRIVIGHRYKVHPAPLQCLVDLLRGAVALPADPVQKRYGTHAGVHRVHVQIALHAPLITGRYYNRGAIAKNIHYMICFHYPRVRS